MAKNPIQDRLDELQEERSQAAAAAASLLTSESYDPESPDLKAFEERAAALDNQIERLGALLASQTAADALDGKLARASKSARSADTEDRSIGEAFVESDAWAQYNYRGTSQKVDIETRALPHALANFSEALALESNTVVDVTPNKPKFTFLPLATVVPVTTNSVDFITWSKVAGAAAVVPEGTLKPSVEFTANTESASLATVAAHTSITRQLAEDSVAVKSYIEGSLQYEVSAKIEAEAKAAVVAAVASIDDVTSPVDSGVSGSILAGQAELEDRGYNPNGFLIRKSDLVALKIAAADKPGTYTPFWGMTPVQVGDADLAAGQVVVADFGKAINHYSRSGISLYATDSHEGNFRLNVLDLLAECRVLTKVVREDAMVSVTEAIA